MRKIYCAASEGFRAPTQMITEIAAASGLAGWDPGQLAKSDTETWIRLWENFLDSNLT